jgi:diketogulonate reductase-like aldo/keto reductase
MLPLTGTTNGAHMRHDLNIFDFTLTRDETETMLSLGGSR